MKRAAPTISRQSTVAFLVAQALVALSIYSVLWTADWRFGQHGRGPWPWELMVQPSAAAALQGMAEVTVGVLGVAITVVSIILELAATRYTPRITDLFLRDRTNVVALSFFVLTTVLVVWINLSLGDGPPPRVMILAEVLLISISLLALLPYFAYVFDFLAPTRVVRYIGGIGVAAIGRTTKPQQVEASRLEVVYAIDQLGDMAHKAVQNQDKNIATAATAALGEVMVAAIERHRALPDSWFDAYDELRQDADLVSFHRDVVRSLVPRRTWLLMKGLRQYQSAFLETINTMRDVGHLVAIQTRRVAVRAAEADDPEGLRLALRFINTFSRAAINARDVRSAYNLMNEYRLLAQGLLGTSQQAALLEVASHIKGYGQLGFRTNLPFLLETAAYDLCTLLEHVHAAGADEHDALLAIFLDVDREPDGTAVQEAALRGVRKAQIKLATWYLLHEQPEQARRIHRDMQHETPARLLSIRREIERTTEEEYWEISDRGANFDYLPPERRAFLAEFFGWFPP